jgi:Aspartyl protease
MHRLSFSVRQSYSEDSNGISVEVSLRSNGLELRIMAKVDTGSHFCIFARDIAEALDIDVESGIPQRIRTANGSFDTFGHELTCSVLKHDFTAIVYFAADRDIDRNVLGRRGWLDQLRVAIIDYDRHLFIADYNLAETEF